MHFRVLGELDRPDEGRIHNRRETSGFERLRFSLLGPYHRDARDRAP